MGTLGATHKIKIDYSAPDIYNYFKETYGNKLGLTQKEFNGFTKEFFEKVTDLMINENMEFIMPKRMGILRIIKYKVKLKLYENGNLDKRSLRPNWAATRKLWKEIYPDMPWDQVVKINRKPMIYHENKHTDGYNLKWQWDKRICLVPNKTAYSFDMARRIDRKLATYLKDESKELDFYTVV